MEFLVALALVGSLGVPGRTNANVSIASDGPFVTAVWAASADGGSTDIYAAVSRDGGTTFSSPVRVNSTEGDARVSGEQPPRVVLRSQPGATPGIVVIWTSKGAAGTTLLSGRSDDGGRTFGRSAIVGGADAPGTRGWQSATVDAHGTVRTLWLDHRELAQQESAGASHQHAGHDASAAARRDGVAMAQRSKLYMAALGDPASARAITGGVCYCCKTSLVTGPGDAIFAAWRHVYPGNLRDIAFTVSRDGGRTFAEPIRVSQDKWVLDGCPDDGPAMAVDGQGRVHIVWPTLVADDKGQPTIGIFYATSRDGRSFTERERVPTEGTPHHPQLTISQGTVFLAWDELKAGTRRAILASRPLDGSSKAAFTRQTLTGSGAALYPVIAPAGNGVVAAWTEGASSESIIRLARVP